MSDKKIRITKTMRFDDIEALLRGEPVTYGTTIEDAIAVLEKEKSLLAKKNASSGEKKPTADQVKNEEYKGYILDYLATLDADTDGVTCTEIMKAIPALSEYQVQKTAALVRQLKEAGKVTSQQVKGKALFRMA
jgi:hypothetical protein